MSDLQERYAELMHAAVDGKASPEQLVELREYLAVHPEAQKEHGELEKLTGILNQIEPIATPADLHASIMKGLPKERPAVEIGLWKSRSRFSIPILRYGYALAAGVVLGAVLTGVMLKSLSPEEKSDVYGTMASVKNAQHSQVAEQMKLVAPGLGGTVELRLSGDREFAVFAMDSSQPVEVEVRVESESNLAGFSQEPSGIRSFEAKGSSIRFRSEGRQDSTLQLTGAKPGSVALNVSFYEQGKLVQEGRLAAAPEGSRK